MKKPSFSLLETLIATAVLIIVTLAIVGLSNSLIAGTVTNADKTIINRWAAEGIELTEKVRDDHVIGKINDPATGLLNWFNPAIADNAANYGWYKLATTDGKTWGLVPTALPDNLSANLFKEGSNAETLTSDETVGYRLICVEAVSASASSDDSQVIHCNTQGSTVLQDGSRSELSTCQTGIPGQPNDLYCQMTAPSVNKNHLSSTKIIPAGNAVKIRSVVVWEDKTQFRSSSIATLITNWKGSEQ